jgi:ABC-2 type transport system permease protein
MRRIIVIEFRQLIRGKAAPMGLALVAAAALAGLHHGWTTIQRQRTAIDASVLLQREQHQAVLASQPPSGNAGDQLYYLFFHTVHEPSQWAPISIGQRDIQPFNLKIRLLALHGQLYDADVVNPLLAAFGNFDLSFVLVLLAPLLVIALSYDVWSSEREYGTWDLVRSQPMREMHVLGVKLAIRMGVILAALALILVQSALVLNLPFDVRFLSALLLTMTYVIFWTGMAAVVIATGRSSDFNLVTLLGLWIFLTVLAPALANVALSVRYPLPEALELTVKQRQGYHSTWDRPVQETMAEFYKHYPEWKTFPVPDDRYSNAWYYAMQQRGDDEATPAATAYFETLRQRDRWMESAATIIPPVAFQLALNDIARTDLDSHLRYLASVQSFHEKLKRFFFPVIFHERTIAEVDWSSVPLHRFRDDRQVRLLDTHGIRLAASAALSLIIGWLTLRWRLRREHVF